MDSFKFFKGYTDPNHRLALLMLELDQNMHSIKLEMQEFDRKMKYWLEIF